MKKARRQKTPVSADNIARLADKGKDVSPFFTNAGRMMGPIQRVNVDFASPMLDELDNAAKELNISRQAVIKTLIRQALDQHYLATARHPAARQRQTKPTSSSPAKSRRKAKFPRSRYVPVRPNFCVLGVLSNSLFHNLCIFNATAYSDSPASTMFLLYFEQLKCDPVLVSAGTEG